MSQYPCSGCGLRSCDGRCYHESDPDAVEFARNMKLLREKYGDPEQFTVCAGDPLLPKNRRAA